MFSIFDRWKFRGDHVITCPDNNQPEVIRLKGLGLGPSGRSGVLSLAGKTGLRAGVFASGQGISGRLPAAGRLQALVSR